MKLVVAVIQDRDSIDLLEELMEAGYRATKLSSTGGFLREGNTTLLIGCDDEDIEEVFGVIESVCRTRDQVVTPITPVRGSTGDSFIPYSVEVTVGGATVFVLDVEQFFHV